MQAVTAQEVTRLSLEDAKAAFDQKTAVFLDVRDADSYASSHIPGALSIPLSELPDRLGELDPECLDHHLLHLTGGRIERPCGVVSSEPGL